MTILGHVLAHKHPGVERIRTIDGEIIISDDPDLHGWPPELGDIPTDEDIATWTAEYEVYKAAMDELLRLEALESPRRMAEAQLTDEGKAWLQANRDAIAVERANL